MGSTYYDSQAVEDDVAQLKFLGINCIATQASLNSDTWPALQDFIDRCKNHNIKVFQAFMYVHPMKPEINGIDP